LHSCDRNHLYGSILRAVQRAVLCVMFPSCVHQFRQNVFGDTRICEGVKECLPVREHVFRILCHSDRKFSNAQHGV
jgi:hypothetical protein